MTEPWLKRWSIIVEGPSRSKKPAPTEPSERVYLGTDDALANVRVENYFMEAKVVTDGASDIFGHQLTVVGSNRRRLLNKQYVGTLQSIQQFSQQAFTSSSRGMGIDNQDQLVILSDGARWISKLAQTQFPKAALIQDW